MRRSSRAVYDMTVRAPRPSAAPVQRQEPRVTCSDRRPSLLHRGPALRPRGGGSAAMDRRRSGRPARKPRPHARTLSRAARPLSNAACVPSCAVSSAHVAPRDALGGGGATLHASGASGGGAPRVLGGLSQGDTCTNKIGRPPVEVAASACHALPHCPTGRQACCTPAVFVRTTRTRPRRCSSVFTGEALNNSIVRARSRPCPTRAKSEPRG